MLVNRSGTMVLPFMTLYMLQRGYTIGQAGIVMGLFGLGAVAGAYLGGKLTDRIGFYRVQLFTLLGGGVLFMTQSRKAGRSRLARWFAGTGLALSVPVPQLLPGQPTTLAGGFSLNWPPPPPWVVLGI